MNGSTPVLEFAVRSSGLPLLLLNRVSAFSEAILIKETWGSEIPPSLPVRIDKVGER